MIPQRVQLHWKEQVEEGLKRDVKMGITEELPANTPAKWCHKMVVTSKPGSPKPRRMVDMSALKTTSYRLTRPGASPLLEAQSVPADSYKTVTDAWQGFHMIPLHEDSREYTNFLTEWGMFRYKRMPMGDHVVMDAYIYRFEKVMVGVENKKRCVDDSLLYSWRSPSSRQPTTCPSWGTMASSSALRSSSSGASLWPGLASPFVQTLSSHSQSATRTG
jgi:hypothetical protein